MTRDERRAELQGKMRTPDGRSYISKRYKQAAGIPEGSLATPGMLVSAQIEAILDYEYPPDDQPKTNA
jgi:hypothetical protein